MGLTWLCVCDWIAGCNGLILSHGLWLYRARGHRTRGNRRTRGLIVLNLDETRKVLAGDVEHQRILLSVTASAGASRGISDGESGACAYRIGARARRNLECVGGAALKALIERCPDCRISEVGA
jgi:hypothetical protein